jgi:hypothetical protein
MDDFSKFVSLIFSSMERCSQSDRKQEWGVSTHSNGLKKQFSAGKTAMVKVNAL